MFELVKVLEVRAENNHCLWLHFTDGSIGVRDFSDILAEGGPMVEPLRDLAEFEKVFVSFGVPTWPNGFDVDAIELHREMKELGLLSKVAA
jgi:hypothetical protein